MQKSVISNLIWRFAERCGAQIVQFIVSIVLARLLAPEAYGTIALVIVFAQILQVFVDSGLGNALIQKKDADDLDFSSVFYFNVVWCLLLYVIIFFCAPLIADFYNDSSLTAVVRVLCLTVVVSGLKNVQQAYVSRNMMFRKFFYATLGGTILSAAAGIIMAEMGFGVWSLVAQKLINLAVDTMILWLTVRWRPKFMFSFERLKELISYGWKLLASALIDTVYSNLRQLIVGKLYSESELAYYNQADKFPNIIVTNINSSIDSVLLPVMSQEQDKKEHVRSMTRKAITVSIYCMAPLMIGLFVTAPILIEMLLTEKWMPCVPYLRIFCLTYMFYPIHTANLNAIKAMGRSDIFLKLEILKKIIGLILLLITARISVMAMAYSLLVNCFTSQLINSYPNWKLLNYNYLAQFRDIFPGIAAAVAMGFAISFINLLPISNLFIFILQLILGSVLYIAFSALFKLWAFEYLWNIVSKIFKKRKSTDRSDNNI